jgi:hypothetical protein
MSGSFLSGRVLNCVYGPSMRGKLSHMRQFALYNVRKQMSICGFEPRILNRAVFKRVLNARFSAFRILAHFLKRDASIS